MSQNIINDLTDRVSALQADVSRLQALAHRNSEAASDAERERDDLRAQLSVEVRTGREVIQTAEGLLGERSRLMAEVGELGASLLEAVEAARRFNRGGMTWFEYDRLLVHLEQVDEIKIVARNNIDA
jgi:hypothetical protein